MAHSTVGSQQPERSDRTLTFDLPCDGLLEGCGKVAFPLIEGRLAGHESGHELSEGERVAVFALERMPTRIFIIDSVVVAPRRCGVIIWNRGFDEPLGRICLFRRRGLWGRANRVR